MSKESKTRVTASDLVIVVEGNNVSHLNEKVEDEIFKMGDYPDMELVDSQYTFEPRQSIVWRPNDHRILDERHMMMLRFKARTI